MDVVLDEIRDTVAEARDDRTASERMPPDGVSGDAIAAASGATMTVVLALAAGGAGGTSGTAGGGGTSSAAVAAIERIVPVPSTSIAPSSTKLTRCSASI